MTTNEHAAMLFAALMEKSANEEKATENFEEMIPWVLLPDAIRAYAGPRWMSHFENVPGTCEAAWMQFPTPEVLKDLSKERFAEEVKVEKGENHPACVIGELSCINVYDNFNQGHPYYRELRAHLRQDMVLDRVLREEMIDADRRFEDIYVMRNVKDCTMDGQTLRKEIATFAQMSYVVLANRIWKQYGVLMDNKWLKAHVYPALCRTYSQDLADRTFRYMGITPEMEAMVRDHTNPEEAAVKLNITGDCFFNIVNAMYDEAIMATHEELDRFLNK